jgi:hypothetical protein
MESATLKQKRSNFRLCFQGNSSPIVYLCMIYFSVSTETDVSVYVTAVSGGP